MKGWGPESAFGRPGSNSGCKSSKKGIGYFRTNAYLCRDIIDSLKREDVDVSIKDDRVIIKTHLRPNKSNKIVGYCRVSTKGQLEGNSIEEQSKSILERYPYAEIIEESYSAAKDRDVFNRIIESLNNGDTLVVTKLDRFCRTTKEGLQYIDLLMHKGVKIQIVFLTSK